MSTINQDYVINDFQAPSVLDDIGGFTEKSTDFDSLPTSLNVLDDLEELALSLENDGKWVLKKPREGAFILLAPNDHLSRFLFLMMAKVEPCIKPETYGNFRKIIYDLTRKTDNPGSSDAKIQRVLAFLGLVHFKLVSRSYFVKTELESVIRDTRPGFNMTGAFNAFRREKCDPNIEPTEDPNHFRFIDINQDTIPTIALLAHYILSTINAYFQTSLEQKWGYSQSLTKDHNVTRVNSFNSFKEMNEHFQETCGSLYKIIDYRNHTADSQIYHEGAKVRHFIFVGLNSEGVEAGALQENNAWWVNQEKVDDQTIKRLKDSKVILEHYELPNFFKEQSHPGSAAAFQLCRNINGRNLPGFLPLTISSFYLAMHALAFERQALPEVGDKLRAMKANMLRIASALKMMFEF